MLINQSNDTRRTQLHAIALSRWENEGGMLGKLPTTPGAVGQMPSDHPKLSNAELVQLRVRVIAMENLLIALLSKADETELQTVRDMAAYITPRTGFTPHPLTIHAATQMMSLIERAIRYAATTCP